MTQKSSRADRLFGRALGATVDPKTIIDGDTFDISVRLLDIRRGHAHR